MLPLGEEAVRDTVAPYDARVLYVDQERTGRGRSVAPREKMHVPFKRVCVLGGVHNNATDFASKLLSFIVVLGNLSGRGSTRTD